MSAIPIPSVKSQQETEQVVAAYLQGIDALYGVRHLLSECRRVWTGTGEPQQAILTIASFRDRLQQFAPGWLLDAPYSPLELAAVRCMCLNLNWHAVAVALADVWTPEEVDRLDTLDAEAQATAWAAALAEADDEPLPSGGWAESYHRGRFAFDAPLDPSDAPAAVA